MVGKKNWFSDPFGLSDLKTLKAEAPRLVFAWLFWFCCMYEVCYSMAWLQLNFASYYEDKWVEKGSAKGHPILWDMGFLYLPDWPAGLDKDKWVHNSVAWLGLAMQLRFWIFPGPNSLRWTILKRFMILTGMIWALRGITMAVTPLPNPDASCYPIFQTWDHTAYRAWQIFSTPGWTCTDVLFSGHFSAISISVLIFVEYVPKAPWFPNLWSGKWGTLLFMLGFNFCCLIWWVGSAYAILSTHFHYTVDIWLALVITFCMFKLYHGAILLAPFSDSFWARALCWFEADSPDLQAWRHEAQQRAARFNELQDEKPFESAALFLRV